MSNGCSERLVQVALQKLVLAATGAQRQQAFAVAYATDKFELQKMMKLGICAARY
jgi:hypothetical protein